MNSRFSFVVKGTVLVIAVLTILGIQAHVLCQDRPLELTVRPYFSSHALTFHDEQLSLNLRKAGLLIGFTTGLVREPLIVTYLATIPFNYSEMVTPSDVLKIGATEFVKANSGGGGKGEKPIQIDYTFRGSHQIKLEFPVTQYVAPLLVGEYFNFALTGQKQDGGKAVQETEAFSRLFAGAGATVRLSTRYAAGDISAAWGDKYSFFEASLKHLFTPDIAMNVGFIHRVHWFGDAKVNENGFYIGANAGF